MEAKPSEAHAYRRSPTGTQCGSHRPRRRRRRKRGRACGPGSGGVSKGCMVGGWGGIRRNKEQHKSYVAKNTGAFSQSSTGRGHTAILGSRVLNQDHYIGQGWRKQREACKCNTARRAPAFLGLQRVHGKTQAGANTIHASPWARSAQPQDPQLPANTKEWKMPRFTHEGPANTGSVKPRDTSTGVRLHAKQPSSVKLTLRFQTSSDGVV
jgi:hypothetical protein